MAQLKLTIALSHYDRHIPFFDGTFVPDTVWGGRFSKVEKLPPTKRRPIVQVIDAFLTGEKAEKGGIVGVMPGSKNSFKAKCGGNF